MTDSIVATNSAWKDHLLKQGKRMIQGYLTKWKPERVIQYDPQALAHNHEHEGFQVDNLFQQFPFQDF
ncbi:hypothetical protein GOBAR_DD26098 [Gossypium barbadense]|nr:hypothetical protein GOBAR_DD26098 [Gossypium barbadense]